MKHPQAERGWVLPLALLGLAVVSGLTTSAWRQAHQGASGFGHAWAHERSRQQAHAELQSFEAAWLAGTSVPARAEVHTVLSTDLGWTGAPQRIVRLTATGWHAGSRVVLQSTWAQALDEHGHASASPQRLSLREVWP